MEDLSSIWNYQESVEELKHKLLCTAVELDTVKMEAKEHMRKSEEYVKRLLDLLSMAQKERDEARDQLQKIHAKITLIPEPPCFTHHAAANRANSSITESNSLGSPPVDSFFDASSPELSNFNASESAFPVRRQLAAERVDPAAMVIESMARKRALPQKGKLLQAVMEAGPLLQTLLVAGPLPRWRNPPPVQPFRIPPVSIAAADASPASYSQTCSASMLNFGGGAGSSGLKSTRMFGMSSSSGHQIPLAKRQRLH